MLRKLSMAIAAGMLVSGVAAAAQGTSPFPMSVNETGSYQPDAYFAPTAGIAAGTLSAVSTTFPISVSEVGPNQSGAYAISAVSTAGSADSAIADSSPFPISVSETGRNYGGRYVVGRLSSTPARTATAR